MTVLPAHLAEKQDHDSHCWLLKGGHLWSIRRVSRDGFIFLRRGTLPIAYTTLDAHRINWERYADRAEALLTQETPT